MSVSLTPKDIHTIVKEFIDFVFSDEGDNEARLEKLQFHLDQLAIAYYFTGNAFDDEEYADPPDNTFVVRWDEINIEFPNQGMYNKAEYCTIRAGETQAITHNLYDDLSDIASEMKEFLWRWENNSQVDALWHFRFSYESHWCKFHLRGIQTYLSLRDSEL